MTQRMQRRLTAVLLLFLIGIYVGFCSVSYFASVQSMKRSGEMMFHSIAHPMPPENGISKVPGQVGMPFFKVNLALDGTIHAVEQGQFDLSENEIAQLAETAMAQQQETGYLDEYGLRYFREPTPDGWSLVFADDSIRRATHEEQLRNNILLGFALLPLFYLFSRWISAFIVRPVVALVSLFQFWSYPPTACPPFFVNRLGSLIRRRD